VAARRKKRKSYIKDPFTDTVTLNILIELLVEFDSCYVERLVKRVAQRTPSHPTRHTIHRRINALQGKEYLEKEERRTGKRGDWKIIKFRKAAREELLGKVAEELIKRDQEPINQTDYQYPDTTDQLQTLERLLIKSLTTELVPDPTLDVEDQHDQQLRDFLQHWRHRVTEISRNLKQAPTHKLIGVDGPEPQPPQTSVINSTLQKIKILSTDYLFKDIEKNHPLKAIPHASTRKLYDLLFAMYKEQEALFHKTLEIATLIQQDTETTQEPAKQPSTIDASILGVSIQHSLLETHQKNPSQTKKSKKTRNPDETDWLTLATDLYNRLVENPNHRIKPPQPDPNLLPLENQARNKINEILEMRDKAARRCADIAVMLQKARNTKHFPGDCHHRPPPQKTTPPADKNNKKHHKKSNKASTKPYTIEPLIEEKIWLIDKRKNLNSSTRNAPTYWSRLQKTQNTD
jgi:hypothetical protein